jgi:hypothetical protein
MIFHHICQAYQKPHFLANVLYDLVSSSKGCTKCLMDGDELNLRKLNRGQNDGHDAPMQTKTIMSLLYEALGPRHNLLFCPSLGIPRDALFSHDLDKYPGKIVHGRKSHTQRWFPSIMLLTRRAKFSIDHLLESSTVYRDVSHAYLPTSIICPKACRMILSSRI